MAKFLRIVSTVPGAVAVCGPMRMVATLTGLHLMRCEGFSASEAAGWLRAVRPGCVSELQERYLKKREDSMRRSATSALYAKSSPKATECGDCVSPQEHSEQCAAMKMQILSAVGTVDARLAAFHLDVRTPAAAADDDAERELSCASPQSSWGAERCKCGTPG